MSNITRTHSSQTTDLSLDNSSDDVQRQNITKRQRINDSTNEPLEMSLESQHPDSPTVHTHSLSSSSQKKETMKKKFYDGIENDIERIIIPENALGKYPLKDNVPDIIDFMSTMKANFGACNEIYTLSNKWTVDGSNLMKTNTNKIVTAYEDVFDVIYNIHEVSEFETNYKQLKGAVEKQSGNITASVVKFYFDIQAGNKRARNPIHNIPLKKEKEDAIQNFKHKLDSFTLKGFISQKLNGGNVVVQRMVTDQHVEATQILQKPDCNLGNMCGITLHISDYLLKQGEQLLSGFDHHCKQYLNADRAGEIPKFEAMVGLFNRKNNIQKNQMSWLNSVTMIIIHQIPEHVIYAISRLSKERISGSPSFLENRKYAKPIEFAVMGYDLIRQMSCRSIKNIATNGETIIGTPYAGGMAHIVRDHYNTCNTTFQINEKSSIGLKSYFDNGLLHFFDRMNRSEPCFCVGKTTLYKKNMFSKEVTKLDRDSDVNGGAFLMKLSQKDISGFESYFSEMRNKINKYFDWADETPDRVHSDFTSEEISMFEKAQNKKHQVMNSNFENSYRNKGDIRLYLQLIMKKMITPTDLVKCAINNVTESEKTNNETKDSEKFQIYRKMDEYPCVITIVFDSVFETKAYGFKTDPIWINANGDESEEDDRTGGKFITKDYKVEEKEREIPFPFELDMTNINNERIEVFRVPQEIDGRNNARRDEDFSRYYEVCGMVVTSMLAIDDDCDDHYECFVKTRVSKNKKKEKWLHFKNNVQKDDIIFNIQSRLGATEGQVNTANMNDKESHEASNVPDLSEYRMIAVFMREDPDYVPKKRSHGRY